MATPSETQVQVITTDQFITSQLTKFEFKKEELQVLAKEYSLLTIEGVDDKEGYSKVHEARMTLVRKRTSIGKVVKELKDVANTFKKSVDERGDEFVEIIQPTENLLWDRESAIDRQKEFIKAEKQRLEDEKIQERINQLAAVGQVADYVTIKGMTEDQFIEELTEAINLHNAKLNREKEEREAKRIQDEKDEIIRLENERLANQLRKEEEEKNRIERERLAKIQEEQDIKEKALRQEQEKFEADRKEFEAIQFKAQSEQRHREQVAKQMREAAEKAAKDKAAEEERLRLQKIEDDRIAEEARIEALNSATDPEKFKQMHKMIYKFIVNSEWPIFTSRNGTSYYQSVIDHMNKAAEICVYQSSKDTDRERS